MSDARDRRRANAQADQKTDPIAMLKKFRVPILIVILWLAIVGYQVAAQKGIVGDPASGCPGHWHAMTDVYIDGDELSFDPNMNRAFSDGARGFHLHDDTGNLHMHPGTERCIELGDVYEFLGLEVTGDSITLSSAVNYQANVAPGTYSTNDTHELRVYEADWNYATGERGDFHRVTNVEKFMNSQIGNGDAVLVTYVAKDVTDEVVMAQQDGINPVSDEYKPATDDIFMPVLAATMFAVLGIAVWRKFAAAA